MDSDERLLVSSVNTWSKGPDYHRRLSRIAEKLRADNPDVAGIAGLQEVTRPLWLPWSGNGGLLFARALAAVFGESVRVVRAGSVAIVVGGEWRLASSAAWQLGRDSWWRNRWSVPSARYLLEAELRHAVSGRTLRFYTAHLSHREEEKRREQLLRLVSIVRGRARPGELPPIVAGDFNAGADSEVARALEEHFVLLHHDTVDLIWAGRGEAFPRSRGRYRVEATSVVDLLSEGLCDAHNAPRVTLHVVD